MKDLVELTAQLVDIPSESFEETAMAEWIEGYLSDLPWLELTRVGDNVVARSDRGRDQRVMLAGHIDTVPAHGNDTARVEGDVVWGLGSCDMKGGLAVMLALAREHQTPALDVTYVFYAREEVGATYSGLGELYEHRPDLLVADAAILGEPTAGRFEAGCQGSVRAEIRIKGRRAHTARPWRGRNAIHRLGDLLAALERYEPRRPEIGGCEYRESVQAVAIEGGVAGNVVPDLVTIRVVHRFAPDRSVREAEDALRDLIKAHLEPGDEFHVVDVALAAPPGLSHPLFHGLIERSRLDVVAKLGWTDVARFAEHGVPAINFGPGDPLLAHTAEERVEREKLEGVYTVLEELLGEQR
ncbi:MAG: succinyl-diaminopimelate desuccinylase [Actinobacteria bacterium]|nr:MAG: succinyl-diaminopimelate desuccinylase [Actinomycetota bacterium]RIK08614.1 MAG: succinyl-diaminopimelate desuccinylase [Acidobacteriota bacterium]